MSRNKLAALWEFSRPHTIIGTTLSVTAIYLMAIATPNLEVNLLLNLISNSRLIWWGCVIACLLANVYIVGINQLSDIDIDKINKPNLPLASGDFSVRQGWIIVLICVILGLTLAASQGQFLLLTVILSLIIGTAYSLPPIRLKRFPFWAAFCVFSVRGLIVNLGLFLHFNYTLNQSLNIPLKVWVLTIFILIFTYVIAIFKDMPDTDGDRCFNVATLSLNWGKLAVFNLSRQILLILYVATALISFSNLGLSSLILVPCHLILSILLWQKSLSVDLSDRKAITEFYQFIWKLFYLEYIIFPIATITI
jgi:homogentisate phytyltransferase / homogentisate geranylgeranyltransferase